MLLFKTVKTQKNISFCKDLKLCKRNIFKNVKGTLKRVSETSVFY